MLERYFVYYQLLLISGNKRIEFLIVILLYEYYLKIYSLHIPRNIILVNKEF